MDALTDTSMENIVAEIHVTGEIKEALLYRTGNTGTILDVVVNYERGDFEHILDLGIQPDAASAAYLKSISQAEGLWESIKSLRV
jgi:EAL and modified HD-GYP domain-containing signal transduction protein